MPQFRYRKPGYVALNVTHRERSVHFYCNVVGLTLEHSEPAHPFRVAATTPAWCAARPITRYERVMPRTEIRASPP